MFEEFDRVIAEEREKFNKTISETLERNRKEFSDALDKLVNDQLEDMNKHRIEKLRKAGFSEEKIAEIINRTSGKEE